MTGPKVRICFVCSTKIKDSESCWRDHVGRHICNTCNDKMRGKYDGVSDTGSEHK